MSELFCTQGNKHNKFIKLCAYCAQKNESQFLFCAKCDRKTNKKHSTHPNMIDSQRLKEKIQCFFTFARQNDVTHLLQQARSGSQQDYLNCIHIHSFRKVFQKAKLWKFNDPSEMNNAKEEIINNLSGSSQHSQSIDDLQKQLRMTINWNCGEIKQLNDVKTLLKIAQQDLSEFKKQEQMINLLIQNVFCTYSERQRRESLKIIKQQISQLKNKKNKEQQGFLVILYFCKLYLMDLHKDNYESQWKQILKQIRGLETKLENKVSYQFIESFRFWRKVTKQKIVEQNIELYTIDPVTKAYYILEEPQQYINCLTKIIISKNTPKNDILLGFRALAYLFVGQSKYNQSRRDFNNALSQNSKLDSIVSNFNYLKFKKLKIPVNLDDLENLVFESKSIQLLTNTIKLAKSINAPQIIIYCSQNILQLENSNEFARLQYIKALLKLNQIDEAQEQINILHQINSQFTEKNIGKLTRKINYTVGKVSLNSRDYQKSTQSLMKNLKNKQTPSALFSYASALYSNNKYQQAAPFIEKARKLKPKNKKYLKLDFYNTLMKRQFEEAKMLLGQMKQTQISPEIKQFLNQI